MGLTRSLLNEMVWPAFKAAKSYVKPKTIGAVRHSAWDRFATILRRPETGADFLPGLEDLSNPTWNRIRDSVWQFKKELTEFQGTHVGTSHGLKSAIDINPRINSPESTGVHELAHHLYSDVLGSRQLKEWERAVKKYGVKTFDKFDTFETGMYSTDYKTVILKPEDALSLNQLRSHPSVANVHYQRQAVNNIGMEIPNWRGVKQRGEHFTADTESLAFTLQEILTPGQEITAPMGMLRAVERIFDAQGLIDRVAHRISTRPPLRPDIAAIMRHGPMPRR